MDIHGRILDSTRSSKAFASDRPGDAIQRIYIINLDRELDRWRRVSRELDRLRDRSDKPLSSLSRRFAAVDSRLIDKVPLDGVLEPQYTLGDQMSVQPIPQLETDGRARARQIQMTPQEMAIALSHIRVWNLIAAGESPYTLVLEDDIYFRRGFVTRVDELWEALRERATSCGPVDVLYLSFKKAMADTKGERSWGPLTRPDPGLWQLSGYVLSANGARKLIEKLPVRGPVDLWLNLKFGELDVLATPRPIIEQRRGVPSTNSYSVMPVLSQVGVHTRERPLVVRNRELPGPVFAHGEAGSGLTALAAGLSILGYRCCSDLNELPLPERRNVLGKGGRREFNAYVNVGGLDARQFPRLAAIHRDARFITTTLGNRYAWHMEGSEDSKLGESSHRHDLVLPADHPDKWELLRTLLGCEYPAIPFPDRPDLGQRRVDTARETQSLRDRSGRRMRFDSSPWIVPSKGWSGISLSDTDAAAALPNVLARTWSGDEIQQGWVARDDTFPSNLALFRPRNLVSSGDGIAKLTMRAERTTVRSFTSAAISSFEPFLYGRFSADLRPSNVPGLITGMFLHRNRPRQEIDLEILGRETRKLIANVFFNPGNEGATMEFGYRGAPTMIDLDFDASADFHRYEIEWRPGSIRWSVDGRLLHERFLWDPTPIPDMPMHFDINLWPSRSKELAGSLIASRLPTASEIGSISIR